MQKQRRLWKRVIKKINTAVRLIFFGGTGRVGMYIGSLWGCAWGWHRHPRLATCPRVHHLRHGFQMYAALSALKILGDGALILRLFDKCAPSVQWCVSATHAGVQLL